jgi:hypothetical protein
MKKEIIIPALIIIFGTLFIVINIFVYFSKGNKWLIKKKLKVGALILALTSVTACHTIPKHTCYEPVQPDENKENKNNMDKIDSVSNTNPTLKDTTKIILCYEMIRKN